jgi:acyl-coenzyme A synthetase/AMP-(fatty) acid ligase
VVVDELPRTASGKIRKREVRERFGGFASPDPDPDPDPDPGPARG